MCADVTQFPFQTNPSTPQSTITSTAPSSLLPSKQQPQNIKLSATVFAPFPSNEHTTISTPSVGSVQHQQQHQPLILHIRSESSRQTMLQTLNRLRNTSTTAAQKSPASTPKSTQKPQNQLRTNSPKVPLSSLLMLKKEKPIDAQNVYQRISKSPSILEKYQSLYNSNQDSNEDEGNEKQMHQDNIELQLFPQKFLASGSAPSTTTKSSIVSVIRYGLTTKKQSNTPITHQKPLHLNETSHQTSNMSNIINQQSDRSDQNIQPNNPSIMIPLKVCSPTAKKSQSSSILAGFTSKSTQSQLSKQVISHSRSSNKLKSQTSFGLQSYFIAPNNPKESQVNLSNSVKPNLSKASRRLSGVPQSPSFNGEVTSQCSLSHYRKQSTSFLHDLLLNERKRESKLSAIYDTQTIVQSSTSPTMGNPPQYQQSIKKVSSANPPNSCLNSHVSKLSVKISDRIPAAKTPNSSIRQPSLGKNTPEVLKLSTPKQSIYQNNILPQQQQQYEQNQEDNNMPAYVSQEQSIPLPVQTSRFSRQSSAESVLRERKLKKSVSPTQSSYFFNSQRNEKQFNGEREKQEIPKQLTGYFSGIAEQRSPINQVEMIATNQIPSIFESLAEYSNLSVNRIKQILLHPELKTFACSSSSSLATNIFSNNKSKFPSNYTQSKITSADRVLDRKKVVKSKSIPASYLTCSKIEIETNKNNEENNYLRTIEETSPTMPLKSTLFDPLRMLQQQKKTHHLKEEHCSPKSKSISSNSSICNLELQKYLQQDSLKSWQNFDDELDDEFASLTARI